METIVIIGVIVVGAGIAVAIMNAKALREAKERYEFALSELSANPSSNDYRIAALEAGRHYADLARKQAGSNGRAIFDEVALQNDMTARLGHGTPSTAPTASVPTDRLSKLAQLGELKDKGLLTADEFESEKRKLLAS